MSTQDEFRVCTHYGIIKRDEKVVCPVDETKCFTSEVTNFKGQFVKVDSCVNWDEPERARASPTLGRNFVLSTIHKKITDNNRRTYNCFHICSCNGS